jgi:hypothetical protein
MTRALATLLASFFLVAASGCDDIAPTDCLKNTLEDPFSMPITATGKISPNKNGHSVTLGMYKKHCEGQLGDRLEYRYATDEEMLYLVQTTLGTYSINVSNTSESMLLDLSVDGFPLTSGGSTSVSAAAYKECRRGISFAFEITCDPGVKQCLGKSTTWKCQ